MKQSQFYNMTGDPSLVKPGTDDDVPSFAE